MARPATRRLMRKFSAVLVLVGYLGASQAYAAEPQVAEPPSSQPPSAESATPQTSTPEAYDVNGNPPYRDMDRINGKYLKGFITDTGKIVTSPLHWDASDWTKAGAVAGVTGGLFFADTAIKNFFQAHKGGIGNPLAAAGNALGDPIYSPAIVGSFYLYSLFWDNPKLRRTSLLAFEGLAISSLFTTGIKNLAQRHRPETGDSPTAFDGPEWNPKNLSFSSGHTAAAFSIATVFANEYQDTKWVPPVAYGLASLTGFARIYDNKHWASDVFFGAALGYFTSKALLAFHKESESGITITPQVSKDMMGLSVGCKF